MSEEKKEAVELKDEDLEKVSGGIYEDHDYITGSGHFSMYTSKMKEINKADGTRYQRNDSSEYFIVTSISNNCNPGEKTPFSTTYYFRAVGSNTIFCFIATKTNNICNVLL